MGKGKAGKTSLEIQTLVGAVNGVFIKIINQINLLIIKFVILLLQKSLRIYILIIT